MMLGSQPATTVKLRAGLKRKRKRHPLSTAGVGHPVHGEDLTMHSDAVG
ncbi:hypothetical protein CCHOA_07445 [Corynebacterium choanae]|uniref:Uncharacterized protein n=1 Tax=Corynebacterium choanae TaxID=1862358 RepID=A0A3G6J6Y7_9CORY|nr:hypothetical protein CCHOA_07445 [Corynebacterium choanae]